LGNWGAAFLSWKNAMKNTSNLTAGYSPEVARQIALSHPGMAHFAASGPFGETCKQCAHYGYYQKVLDAQGNTKRAKFRRGACGKFYELTNKHGPAFPENVEACRYFTRRDGDESATNGTVKKAKLTWTDSWHGSQARASRRIGGNYEIIECPVGMNNVNFDGPMTYEVRYRDRDRVCRVLRPSASSLDEAKAIAEADHDTIQTKR
jgi:hypothetical protein